MDTPNTGPRHRLRVRHNACDDEYNARKTAALLDVDGVISLFGFREGYGLARRRCAVRELPARAPALHQRRHALHIRRPAAPICGGSPSAIELVWATGWEETANDYLPHLLELPGHLPYLTFDGRVAAGAAHWKIDAIAEYAGDPRPLAWIDDNVDESCHDWAAQRAAPTLIIETVRHEGMSEEHVELLLHWEAS